MNDGLVLVATVVAATLTVDFVSSAQGLERARVHDRWILRLMGTGALALWAWDAVAGAVAVVGVVGYWRDGDLRLFFLMNLAGAVWVAAPLLAGAEHLVAVGWAVVALVEGCVALWHWGALRGWWQVVPQGIGLAAIWLGMSPTHPYPGVNQVVKYLTPAGVSAGFPHLRPLSGWHGQHTFLAASLALVFPLAWALWWPAGVALGLMVIGISSWVGIAALLAGFVWSVPRAWPYVAAVPAIGFLLLLPKLRHGRDTWLNLLPRGDSVDSIKMRWHSWTSLARLMCRWPWRTWLDGRGWAGTNLDLLRSALMARREVSQGTAHNDVVEWIYANGIWGVGSMIILVFRVGPHLELADPWSATVIAGLVVACGSAALHYPAVGLAWWLAAAFVGAR